MTTVLMADSTGASSKRLAGFTGRAVAGYVTGSGVVPWSGAQFDAFPHLFKVRINQHDAFKPLVGNVLDIETQAWVINDAVSAVETRLAARRHTTVYMSRALLTGFADALGNRLTVATGDGPYLWLADWSLDEAGARHLVGSHVAGMQVVAVQYASPSSNPDTVLPGTGLTLRQANADLSAVDPAWLHAVAEAPVSEKPPEPPAEHTQSGVVITSKLTAHKVTSHDGKIWTETA